MPWLWWALVAVLTWFVTRAWLAVVRIVSKIRALALLPHPEVGILGLETFKDKDHMPLVHTNLSDKLGGIYGCRLFHIPFVVVTDPALVQVVLSHHHNFPKTASVFQFLNTLTSPGGRQPNIIGHASSTGYWKLVRKGTAPAFNPKNIRAEFGHVVQLGEQLCSVLSSAGPSCLLDVDHLLQRESMDVIGRIGFGTDLRALHRFRLPGTGSSAAGVESRGGGGSGGGVSGGGGEGGLDLDDLFPVIQGAAEEVARRLTHPLRYETRYLTKSGRLGEWYLRRFRARMLALLHEIRSRGPPAEGDMSVAAHLLRIRDPATGKPLSDEALAGEIGLFFFAGFETTGHTMAWTLYLLAQHPEVEARVCAELDALGLLATPASPHPRPLQYDDLGKLTYLGWVIKESMRLIPVVAAGTMRDTTTPMELGGYHLPAGTSIYIPLHALMNTTHNWERPQDFDPDRWREPGAELWFGSRDKRAEATTAVGDEDSTEEEDDTLKGVGDSTQGGRHPKRFLPFGGGPRACIGQNLAKMNYTATLAMLLARFTFELPNKLKGPDALWGLQCNRITLQPKDGLPIRCIPRVGDELAAR